MKKTSYGKALTAHCIFTVLLCELYVGDDQSGFGEKTLS